MSNLPKRYTEGLTPSQIKDLERNIERTKKLINKGKEDEAIKLAEKRPQPAELKTRKSSFTTKLEKLYNVDKLPDTPSKEFQKLTGLSVADQEEIIQRGKKAFLTAGSRRGTNAFAWAKARLYAFIVKTVEANKKGLEKINQDMDIFERVKSKIKM
jgi:hypothetical protein